MGSTGGDAREVESSPGGTFEDGRPIAATSVVAPRSAAGARDRAPARARHLHHADADVEEHERTRHHDRREGRQSDQGRRCLSEWRTTRQCRPRSCPTTPLVNAQPMYENKLHLGFALRTGEWYFAGVTNAVAHLSDDSSLGSRGPFTGAPFISGSCRWIAARYSWMRDTCTLKAASSAAIRLLAIGSLSMWPASTRCFEILLANAADWVYYAATGMTARETAYEPPPIKRSLHCPTSSFDWGESTTGASRRAWMPSSIETL